VIEFRDQIYRTAFIAVQQKRLRREVYEDHVAEATRLYDEICLRMLREVAASDMALHGSHVDFLFLASQPLRVKPREQTNRVQVGAGVW
jgi:hypothetical protein